MPLSDLDSLHRTLQLHGGDRQQISQLIQTASASLYDAFLPNQSIKPYLRQLTVYIDTILAHELKIFIGEENLQHMALVATGGYGRKELLPGSDIDLLLLIEAHSNDDLLEKVSSFITHLWDLGLDIGHSVRTVEQCAEEARDDITIITNLIESRLICGKSELFERMNEAISTQHMWNPKDFFAAKLEEQKKRHLRFNDTAYNLEPNVKEGPGGLRDIQTIRWVAKRQFGTLDFTILREHGFITAEECQQLEDDQEFLWRVRFALHSITHRKENRLLFNHQRQLANRFGATPEEPDHVAVERFMQNYYRTIQELQRINEMLLQIFRDEILYQDDESWGRLIDKNFLIRNNAIEVTHESVFEEDSGTILQMFVHLQKEPNNVGVKASTIRLMRQNLHRIDDDFRQAPKNQQLFLDFLGHGVGTTQQIRRMNNYGVLAAYIPEFGKIVGRMQYDLFHAYTVDQHTLFVIRNLRRMASSKYADELPLCHDIFLSLDNPKLLLIAGLFHDIGKGRGGDHSLIGEKDVKKFCILHQLNKRDTRLVAQLVRDHLLMSMTAQRKDLSDQQVIHEFAQKIGTEEVLNYLYLLTVADIRATNPSLWNAWKDSLLKELYHATKHRLRRGLERPLDIKAMVLENKEEACQLLGVQSFSKAEMDALCDELPDDYFLRNRPEEIAWHTTTILQQSLTPDQPLVYTRYAEKHQTSEIFIYTADHHGVFSIITRALDSLGVSILDARIFTTNHGYSIDTFIVLEENGDEIATEERLLEIRKTLTFALENPSRFPRQVARHIPRQLKSFSVATKVRGIIDETNQRLIIELNTSDRPGLLSRVAQVLERSGYDLSNAKITTLGERVDDIFFLQPRDGVTITELLAQEKLQELQNNLISDLNS